MSGLKTFKPLESEELSSREKDRSITLISVSVQNLTKVYREPSRGKKSGKPSSFGVITANKNISLEIRRGEIFGLLGPNGAGKTTLVNQILGLTKPTSGNIFIEGLDVMRQTEEVKYLSAYLPQQGINQIWLDVFNYLTYTGRYRGLTKIEAKHQARQLIADLGLDQAVGRAIPRLSGGTKRLVNLAAALMGQAKLLVLDEPTNELDPARRRQVWDYLKQTILDRKATCILVTHNVLEAETVLDRLAIIDRGEVKVIGTPGELKQQFSNQARLELVFKQPFPNPGGNHTELSLPQSPISRVLHKLQLNQFTQMETYADNPLRYRLYLPLEQATYVMQSLEQEVGWSSLDDLKLALPSLEDVYLKLVKATNQEASTGLEEVTED